VTNEKIFTFKDHSFYKYRKMPPSDISSNIRPHTENNEDGGKEQLQASH